MKKPILITGPRESGKTFLAQNMMYAFDAPLCIDARSKKDLNSKWLYQDADRNTDLIVFDDLNSDQIISLLSSLESPMVINRNGTFPLLIDTPQIIITTTLKSGQHLPDSMKRRMKHIMCNCSNSDSGKQIFTFYKSQN